VAWNLPWIVVSLAILGASVASAQTPAEDYRIESGQWNSLSRLLDIASGAGVAIDTPASLDLADLGPNDALLLIHPVEELPRGSLAAFLRGGGRVAIADDFGTSEPFLEIYGIERGEYVPDEDDPRLRGNPALPVATTRLRHPLSRDVRTLVTNHPAVLWHAELEPVLGFEADRSGVVLTGAVEEGRLVVVSDPSVLIDNMLQYRDNRRFATNLLRYLQGDGTGRVLLVTQHVELEGRHGTGAEDPVERLRSWLEDAAHAETPPVALTLLAVVLVAILGVFAVSSLPLRSPYDAKTLRPPPGVGGGYAGRVEYFARRSDLIHPLMVYKFELEGELLRRLSLHEGAVLKDVMAALEKRRLPARQLAEARQLLLTLDDLRRRVDLPPAPPKITPRRLQQLVDQGERLLAAVPDEHLRGAA